MQDRRRSEGATSQQEERAGEDAQGEGREDVSRTYVEWRRRKTHRGPAPAGNGHINNNIGSTVEVNMWKKTEALRS